MSEKFFLQMLKQKMSNKVLTVIKKPYWALLPMFVLFLESCSNKGKTILEPQFGTYRFRTYTVDSFRFRVVLNGEVLTDSLLSPMGLFSKAISFFNTNGRLQIMDLKNNNQLILDTAIQMSTGTSSFSLVQFIKGQKPAIPALPNEPPPSVDKFKVRFQYLSYPGDNDNMIPPQPFFYDSVRCIIRNNGIAIDTIVLKKLDVTPYYEGSIGISSFSIRLENAATNLLVDANTSPSVGTGLIGFNTASLSAASNNDFRIMPIY